MRTWSVLGFLVAGSFLWVVGDGTPALAGFSDQRACEDKLFSQGLKRRDVEPRCEVCFLNPGSSACREQFKGGSSDSSSGSGSTGRSGGGSSRGSSDGPDTSQLNKIGRNAQTGASFECVDQVGRSGMIMGNITITYKNICGHDVIVEQVCANEGMFPIGEKSDNWKVRANGSTTVQCDVKQR